MPSPVIPKTMKAAVLHGIHDLRLEEVPVPEIGADEVLIRIRACGLCTSDIHYLEHGRIGTHIVTRPMILGHEVAGDVVKLGADVKTLEIGTRVAVEAGPTCGKCEFCKGHKYNLCEAIEFYATPPFDGAMAEYQKIRADFAFPLPDRATYAQGALCEPISVGLHSANLTGLKAGDVVVVLGAGPIGLTSIVAALGRGAREVIISDVLPNRLEMATHLGAIPVDVRTQDLKEVVMAQTRGMGADILFDTAGIRSALEAAPAMMKNGGDIALIAPIDTDVTFSLFDIQDREVSIHGVKRYSNTYPAAVALVSSGRYPIEDIITSRYPLDDVLKAFEEANGHKDKVTKVLIEP